MIKRYKQALSINSNINSQSHTHSLRIIVSRSMYGESV